MEPTTIRSPGTPNPLSYESTDVGLDELLRVIFRRKWTVIGIVVGATALAALTTSLMTPRYTAETLVLIDPQDTTVVSLESVVGGISRDQESVQSEAYVLASRALAGRVIRRLALDKDPEFATKAGANAAPPADAAQAVAAEHSFGEVVDRFLDRLTVTPRENSRVIAVTFKSTSPRRAAEAANTLVDEYLQSRLEAKFQSTRRANSWLSARVTEMQQKVEATERQVEALRRKFGLVGSGRGTLSSQELVELNTQLILARTTRADAEARLRRVEDLVDSPSGATTASEVLNSPLIQRLREQEAGIQRRVAELSSELGERHPKMVQLRAESEDLRTSIQTEIAKIVAGLRNEVTVARSREIALQRSLDATRERVAIDNEDEIRLRAAEREAEANRSLLATLLARQKAAMSQEDMESQQADARVVAPADPPVEPSVPNKPAVLALTVLGSTLLGLLAIFVLEMLDNGYRSGDQIELALGVNSLGFVPLAAGKPSTQDLLDYLASRPRSAFGEAIRTLAWSIGLVSPDESPRTVLITSTLPDEGKTSIATTLAWVQSRAGQRVVIVDADARRPIIHSAFKVPQQPGLLDVLTGRVKLDEALHRNDEAGPAVLSSGTSIANIPGLLGSRRMETLLKLLRDQFDLVIIDSPPVLAAADARILAQKADATVLVVQWAKTPRQAVRLAVRQLRSTGGARLAGALLTQVNARKHAQYSYGDSGAYTGALEKYYTS
jgi:capsular exopolysaccharide synthesis family protein